MKKILKKIKDSYKKFSSDRHLSRIVKYSLIIFFVIIAGAVGILLFEYGNEQGNIKNSFDAIWWALVTITTVGYGDLVPVTFWGRIIGIIFILMGFIIFSIFTAFIASSFIDRKIKEGRGMSNIKDRQHILICGWNASVLKILDFLKKVNTREKNPIVLLNELDEGRISTIINHYPQLDLKYICGDYTNQEILIKANAKEAKHIILLCDESKANTIPSDERTIIASHNINFLKIKGKVSLQLKDQKYAQNIRNRDIQNVVIFDEIGGTILATSTLNPVIPEFIQEALNFKDGRGFSQVDIPHEFVSKTFLELFSYFKEKKELILLGIVSMQPEFSIDNVLSDDTSAIDQFIKKQFELSKKKLKLEETKSLIKIKPENSYVIQETDQAIVI